MGDLQPLYGVAWPRDFGTQRGHVYLQADTPALLMAAATKLDQPLKTDGCIFKIKA
jgi:formate-dependent nitrite reductase cytochrome c552 subunit